MRKRKQSERDHRGCPAESKIGGFVRRFMRWFEDGGVQWLTEGQDRISRERYSPKLNHQQNQWETGKKRGT